MHGGAEWAASGGMSCRCSQAGELPVAGGPCRAARLFKRNRNFNWEQTTGQKLPKSYRKLLGCTKEVSVKSSGAGKHFENSRFCAAPTSSATAGPAGAHIIIYTGIAFASRLGPSALIK